MSLENVIEKQLQQAIERGELDNLEGKGRPLDLSAYFNTPEDRRLAYALLKSSHFVPEEVDLMNEIAALRDELSTSADPAQKATLVKTINEKSLKLNLALERYKQKP